MVIACKSCGKEFEQGNYLGKRYCSDACRKTDMRDVYRERQKEWYRKNREKVISQVTGYRKAHAERVRKWNLNYAYRAIYNGMRIALREKHGNACSRCGVVGERLQDIHVHHIDFNRENNSEENLILLCRSCHRSIHMAHTMKIYWQNKRSSTG